MIKWGLTERNREIVLAYAENNMGLSETARKTFFHHNNVHYHLNQVKQKTGLDPRNFYDLIKLVHEFTKEDGADLIRRDDALAVARYSKNPVEGIENLPSVDAMVVRRERYVLWKTQ